jgi:hypothetical protein
MGEFTNFFLFTNNTREINRYIENNVLGSAISIIFLIYILAGIWIKSRKGLSGFFSALLFVFFAAIGTGGTLYALNNRLEDKKYYDDKYQNLLNVYNSQSYKIAEGEVHVLYSQPFSGHTQGDIINVGGIELEISYFQLTFGYNQTIAHGGVLREGVYARIYYTDDVILRIDLKKSD